MMLQRCSNGNVIVWIWSCNYTRSVY